MAGTIYLWVRLLSTPATILPIMTTNGKKTEKIVSTEIDLIKKELEAFHENPDEMPGFVLTESGKYLKIIKTGKTYNVRIDHAFNILMDELQEDEDIDPAELRKEFEFLLDEITEFMLKRIGVDQYLRYRTLIRASGYFFAELLTPVRDKKFPIT